MKSVIAMKHQVGTVKELWRYPVKSMAGELVSTATIEKLGLLGDRNWAIRDEEKQETSNVRKLPKLLQCQAVYHAEPCGGQVGDQIPSVHISLKNGVTFNSTDSDANQLLSEYLQKRVSIRARQPLSNWRFYRLKSIDGEAAMKKQFNTRQALPNMASISWFKMLELSIFSTPLGRFYDVYPLHIVSSNSIQMLKKLEPEGDFKALRFRPNIFIESTSQHANFDEFDWIGGTLYIGEVVVRCSSKTVRCSMPAQPQVYCKKDSKVLRTLEKYSERHLGLNATVIKTGNIKVGDSVYWQPEATYTLRKMFQPVSDALKNTIMQTTLKLIDKLAQS